MVPIGAAATMNEVYQQRQRQLIASTVPPIKEPNGRSQHKRTRQIEEEGEEGKTSMVDEDEDLTPTVAMALSTVDAQPIAKKAKLGLKESEIDQTAGDVQTELSTPLDQSIRMEQSLSPFNSDAIPTLLDTAMRWGDSALAHQFLTLLYMDDPPLDLNSKSFLYGDTIGMRLFHLLQRLDARASPHLCELFHENSRRINKLMMDTIDPNITNQQGQTMLHVIADATNYSNGLKFQPSASMLPSNSVDLILALILRGANVLARDCAGKVAIIEIVRNHSLIGFTMDKLFDLLMAHQPVELLFNVSNNDGTSLLRFSGSENGHLITRLASERQIFRQIDFDCDPEFGLLQVQAMNDEQRKSFISDSVREHRPRKLLDEIKRYELIQTAIDDWIQFHRPTRRSMLEPFLVRDLASIVTDYWIGYEPREPKILLSLQEGSLFHVLELASNDRTIDSLRAKISSAIIYRRSPPPYTVQVDKNSIKTDEDVLALTNGQRIRIIYASSADDDEEEDEDEDDDVESDDDTDASESDYESEEESE